MLNKDGRGNVVRARARAQDSEPDTKAMRAAARVAESARKMPAAIGADEAAALKKLTRQAGQAARLLKLLGNEKRLLVLCFLAVRGEMTVGELVDVVKLSQSALSQHLGKLRADGVVAFRRSAQTLHYRVVDPRALQVLQVLKEIYCGDLK
jgi:ArsR family transcriptional regulator, virulence genes transcriptional regulator